MHINLGVCKLNYCCVNQFVDAELALVNAELALVNAELAWH